MSDCCKHLYFPKRQMRCSLQTVCGGLRVAQCSCCLRDSGGGLRASRCAVQIRHVDYSVFGVAALHVFIDTSILPMDFIALCPVFCQDHGHKKDISYF